MATVQEQIQAIKAWIRIMRKETCERVLESLEKDNVGTCKELKVKLRNLLDEEDVELIRHVINFKTKLDEEKLVSIKTRDPSRTNENEDLDQDSGEEEEVETDDGCGEEGAHSTLLATTLF